MIESQSYYSLLSILLHQSKYAAPKSTKTALLLALKKDLFCSTSSKIHCVMCKTANAYLTPTKNLQVLKYMNDAEREAQVILIVFLTN